MFNVHANVNNARNAVVVADDERMPRPQHTNCLAIFICVLQLLSSPFFTPIATVYGMVLLPFSPNIICSFFLNRISLKIKERNQSYQSSGQRLLLRNRSRILPLSLCNNLNMIFFLPTLSQHLIAASSSSSYQARSYCKVYQLVLQIIQSSCQFYYHQYSLCFIDYPHSSLPFPLPPSLFLSPPPKIQIQSVQAQSTQIFDEYSHKS